MVFSPVNDYSDHSRHLLLLLAVNVFSHSNYAPRQLQRLDPVFSNLSELILPSVKWTDCHSL